MDASELHSAPKKAFYRIRNLQLPRRDASSSSSSSDCHVNLFLSMACGQIPIVPTLGTRESKSCPLQVECDIWGVCDARRAECLLCAAAARPERHRQVDGAHGRGQYLRQHISPLRVRVQRAYEAHPAGHAAILGADRILPDRELVPVCLFEGALFWRKVPFLDPSLMLPEASLMSLQCREEWLVENDVVGCLQFCCHIQVYLLLKLL